MSQPSNNQNQRQARTNFEGKPGPFLAVVTNHLDSKNMGSLEVELLKVTDAGNSTEKTGQTVPVQYLNPFYGVTPYKGVSKNEGFAYTQKSYGMWAVPPDIGTKVLVIFAEGNFGQGFWIGCVQDEHMNFMLPGYASTTFNSADKSKPLPVGEYNKKVEDGAGKDPTKFVKPVDDIRKGILDNAGLASDHTRGTTTSSARRETPSMVFGFSTPGPADRRPGAPRVKYGEQFAQSDVAFNRLTGSSFVMDDGDASLLRKTSASEGPPEYASVEKGETGDVTLPHNDLIRLKTRTGHQILMHNSEELIYIANGKGTAWIELTSNGKIDIYAKDSVSIHSENDFNLKADRDINIEAGNNINMISGKGMFTQTGENWEVKVGADGKITCEGRYDGSSNGMYLTSDPLHLNGPVAQEASEAKPPLRQPQHEPWTGHENLNPAEHTPEKTDASNPANILALNGATAEGEFTPVLDTFSKPT